MDIESIFPHTLFYVGGIPIRDTVLQTWIVVAVLAALSLWARRRYRAWNPRTWQLAIEYVIEYIENLIVSFGGRPLPEAVPYLTTLISFIAVANLLGLLPLLQAPTRDLNTTIALSLVSLGSCHSFSIQRRGVRGFLRSFIEPVAVMLPLNLMAQFSRVLSMSLRLFGNVIAGEIIVGVMYIMAPLISPLLMSALGMITGVLQALVFTMLTLVFVIEAMGISEASSVEGAASLEV